jgi:hypothetical protein
LFGGVIGAAAVGGVIGRGVVVVVGVGPGCDGGVPCADRASSQSSMIHAGSLGGEAWWRAGNCVALLR